MDERLAKGLVACAGGASCNTLRRAREAERAAAALPPARRPLICVTPCVRLGENDRTSSNEYATDVFLEAIVAAGGMPVVMPITTDPGLVRAYVDACDGFALPGGAGPDPSLWGDAPSEDMGLSAPRDALEAPLIEEVLAADKPLLAICRGEQLLNFVCGGTVSRDLLSVPCPLATHWTHWGIHWEPAHEVVVEPGTLLSRCVGGATRLQVNSNHRQCVLRAGKDMVVSARATDNVVEAVELPSARFCLGVQWHPEYTWGSIPTDALLWRALVDASAGRA